MNVISTFKAQFLKQFYRKNEEKFILEKQKLY